MSRIVRVRLDDAEFDAVTREIGRLHIKYGLKLSAGDILRSAIRAHIINVRFEAENSQDAVWWMHRLKYEGEEKYEFGRYREVEPFWWADGNGSCNVCPGGKANRRRKGAGR